METSREETTGAGGGQHKDESGNLRDEFLSLCLSHAEVGRCRRRTRGPVKVAVKLSLLW